MNTHRLRHRESPSPSSAAQSKPTESPQTIPRRLIQTGKDSQLTLAQQGFVANVKLLNPTFEYRFFDDAQVEAFVDAEYPEYRAVMNGFRIKIQKIDFFRYLVVYKYGGFYLDLDVLLAKGIEPLVSAGCVFPFESIGVSAYLREKYRSDCQIGNYAFGATAGHPFLGAVIDNCVRAQRDPGWVTPMMRGVPFLSKSEHYVLCTTGPGLLTRTFIERPDLSSSVSVLMQEDVCEPSTWHRFGEYGVHLMAGSWRKRRSIVEKKLADFFEVRWQNRMRDEILRERQRRSEARSGGSVSSRGPTE